MEAFVRSRNSQPRKDGAHVVNDDIEELKVPVPSLMPQDSTHPAFIKPTVPPSPAKGATKPRENAAQSFGTQYHHDREHFSQYLSPEDAASFDDIDDFDAGFEPPPAIEIEKLKQKKLAEIKETRLIDKYVDGDSYPDTTSGRLTDDGGDVAQPFTAPLMQVTEPSLSGFRMAPPPKRTGSQSKPTINEPTAHKGNHKGAKHRSSTKLLHEGVGSQHVEASQARVSTKRGSISAKESLSERPDTPASEHSGPALEHKDKDVRKRTIRDKDRKRRSTAQQLDSIHDPYSALKDATIDLPDQEITPASLWPVRDPKPHKFNDITVSPMPQLQQPEVSTMLDYEEKALFNLQYEQLKTQDFDVDPHAAAVDGPSDIQLDLKAQLSPEEWAVHFDSLSLEKWEDAGDWFVTQFADILSRLKAARRAKRSTAQQFEKEVEDRHNEIVKKRIVIGDTMQGMREHGAQVLDKHEKEGQHAS